MYNYEVIKDGKVVCIVEKVSRVVSSSHSVQFYRGPSLVVAEIAWSVFDYYTLVSIQDQQ